MSRRQGQLKLGGFFHPTGNHVASWLHPEAQIDAGVNFRQYVELAQTAERGKFDLFFLRDNPATRDGNLEALKRWPQYMCYFEPTTLLSAIAALTSRSAMQRRLKEGYLKMIPISEHSIVRLNASALPLGEDAVQPISNKRAGR